MEKFLIFIDAADDAAMYPVSKIQSMTVASDATLLIKFAPGSLGDGQAASVDVVTLTVTADTELKVFKSIAEAISGNSFKPNGYIVVADDVNGVYVDSDITACAIALDA
jgi:hypothetical protein|tara:strand:- start:97 stop:423 length:327 start_codon:yes stop_codon:yes gene_type:complete